MGNETSQPRVGFIGLGNMGGPMARNIIHAGFPTQVCDLDEAKVAAACAAGATAASTPAETAADVDILLTSLPGPAQVRDVGRQVLDAMAPGTLWIDLSTNDLDCARTIAGWADAAGVRVLDAPVTGGAEGAEAGTLTVLIGGDEADVASATPVLSAIGERLEHLGPHGAGYVAKITQVTLCYLHSVCLTEALVLGAKGGVHPEKMLDIIRHSTGRSYVADRYGPEILNGEYDATFALGLALKDMRLATSLAESVGAKLPFMADVTDFYAKATAEFGADAPHLMAVHAIERDNDLILHQEMNP